MGACTEGKPSGGCNHRNRNGDVNGGGGGGGGGGVKEAAWGPGANVGRRPVAAETLEFPSEDDGRRSPKSWMTTSVAMNFFLVFAVIYHEWSRVHASTGLLSSFQGGSAAAPADWSTGAASYCPEIVSTQSACSGHGVYEPEYGTGRGECRCHACFHGPDCSIEDSTGCVIDIYQGDPTMYETYWMHNGHTCTTVILGWQRMSYYANSAQFFFVQTELDQVIRSLHDAVGNAVTQDRHIVIGVGSTQLFQAALYALSSPSRSSPTSVVSLAPYYSSYATVTDYLRSALYSWAGDAAKFQLLDEDGAYIELVTSPNNPTGEIRRPVVVNEPNGTGALVHDLAYYWPQYTPIAEAVDEDLMLFTISKTTGHAGTRIGWAIVKDPKVAQKMAKFIELNTIGISKDAQIRATNVLRSVTDGYRASRPALPDRTTSGEVRAQIQAQALFHFGASEMSYRWMRLQSALSLGLRFKLPEFQPAFCSFFAESRTPTPAFAWLKCKHEADCEKFLKVHGILTRSGLYFGADASFVRLSMLDRRPTFEILMDRLAIIDRS